LKKAKKKRKDETEEDSDSIPSKNRIHRSGPKESLARRRLNRPRLGSGGGHPPPGGSFIHHSFRYGPEPPAYKTPKPEHPSYPRRETERPATHDRHVVIEKSVDDRTIDRLIRKFLKDITESDDLPDEEDRLEPELGENVDDLPNPRPRDLLKVAGILEQQPSRIEFQPIMDIGKRRQEPRERDPEQLLKELEAYPTEELRDKALAELNKESSFVEEEMEDSKVETNALPSTEFASKGIERHAEHSPRIGTEHANLESDATPLGKPGIELPSEQTALDSYSEATPQIPVEMGPISEAEIFEDVQDLIHELEPEIEEQEEVEPAY